MVSSGLAPGMLDVASYRLAVHLGLAFVILALIAWYVLQLGREEAELMAARREGDRRLKGMATGSCT
jgi:cytochrome c oxidase assembly protein subunit 15